jgi:hypothetical protein
MLQPDHALIGGYQGQISRPEGKNPVGNNAGDLV